MNHDASIQQDAHISPGAYPSSRWWCLFPGDPTPSTSRDPDNINLHLGNTIPPPSIIITGGLHTPVTARLATVGRRRGPRPASSLHRATRRVRAAPRGRAGHLRLRQQTAVPAAASCARGERPTPRAPAGSPLGSPVGSPLPRALWPPAAPRSGMPAPAVPCPPDEPSGRTSMRSGSALPVGTRHGPMSRGARRVRAGCKHAADRVSEARSESPRARRATGTRAACVTQAAGASRRVKVCGLVGAGEVGQPGACVHDAGDGGSGRRGGRRGRSTSPCLYGAEREAQAPRAAPPHPRPARQPHAEEALDRQRLCDGLRPCTRGAVPRMASRPTSLRLPLMLLMTSPF
jgi:hypothetical protein